jgi:hypothetical protein
LCRAQIAVSGDTSVEINKEVLADNEFDYLLISLLKVVTVFWHIDVQNIVNEAVVSVSAHVTA